MGGGQDIDTTQDLTNTVTLPKATAQETALLDQLGGLIGPQLDTAEQLLQRVTDPFRSIFDLDPASKRVVDDARDTARQRLQQDFRDSLDFAAGGRGLRISDAPVAQQALDRLGQAAREFETDWALRNLNVAMTANQAQQQQALQAAQFLPPALMAQLQAKRDERFAQATQRSVGRSAGSMTFVPPVPSLLGGAGSAIQGALGINQAFGGIGGGSALANSLAGSAGLVPTFAGSQAIGSALGSSAGLGGLAAGGGAGLAGLTGTVAPAALAATAPASGLITGGGMAAIAGLGAMF